MMEKNKTGKIKPSDTVRATAQIQATKYKGTQISAMKPADLAAIVEAMAIKTGVAGKDGKVL
jgi:hypothetical protein